MRWNGTRSDRPNFFSFSPPVQLTEPQYCGSFEGLAFAARDHRGNGSIIRERTHTVLGAARADWKPVA